MIGRGIHRKVRPFTGDNARFLESVVMCAGVEGSEVNGRKIAVGLYNAGAVCGKHSIDIGAHTVDYRPQTSVIAQIFICDSSFGVVGRSHAHLRIEAKHLFANLVAETAHHSHSELHDSDGDGHTGHGDDSPGAGAARAPGADAQARCYPGRYIHRAERRNLRTRQMSAAVATALARAAGHVSPRPTLSTVTSGVPARM